MLTDRITITSHGVSTARGFWWSPIKEEFAFADVDTIISTTSRDSSGHWHPVWDVHLRDGRVQQMTIGDLWLIHAEEIRTQLHAHGIEVFGQTTTRNNSRSLITQVGLPLIAIALITSWIGFQIYYRRKSASTPPPISPQTQGTITLFKFDVPEIAHLPLTEQEKLLSTCMSNPAVQAAYYRYWQRPGQWALAPTAIIGIVSGVKDWSLWWMIGACLTLMIPLFLIIRPIYKRQLIAVTRAYLLAEIARKSPGSTGSNANIVAPE